MILSFTPNPCVDKTVFLDEITLGGKMRAPRYECIAGGKGVNVARAVKTMGRPSRAMVVVGGHTGRMVAEMIEQADDVDCVPVWVDSPTRTITTVLEEKHHRQTAFFEPGSILSAGDRAAIVALFEKAVQGARVVSFNGAVPDRSIETIYRDLIPIAREAGALTILDTYGPELEAGLEASPDMVKPNTEEAAAWAGFKLDSRKAMRRAADKFHEHGAGLVVITAGAENALVSRDGECLRVSPPSIKEVNPVGSGDALVAGFAIGLMEGMALDRMAAFACAMGAANAKCWDIGHFEPREVEKLQKKVRVKPW